MGLGIVHLSIPRIVGFRAALGTDAWFGALAVLHVAIAIVPG